MTVSRIIVGDVRQVLKRLEAGSVHCVVTSPPYWGLRDYGVEGQLGLEESPEAWVEQLVAAFDEVHRVLRKDGTVWLNVGDAYCSSGSHGPGRSDMLLERPKNHRAEYRAANGVRERGVQGFKHKDRLGLPHMLVFALRAAGWYWRDEIIWHKTAPMPESTRDRTTQSHEFVFLLSKSSRYFYDQDAVREPASGTAHSRGLGPPPQGWDTGPGNHRLKRGRYRPGDPGGFDQAVRRVVTTRNKRSVWTLPPEPFAGAHFATFPTKLVTPCVEAGTSERGVCPECGTPWTRVVEFGGADVDHQRACGGDANGLYSGAATKDYGAAGAEDPSAVKARILAGMRERKTVGWEPGCEHVCDPVPATLLDPFSGAGTTGLVAQRLGRSYIGCELNPEYAELSRKRIRDDSPLWSSPTVELAS